MIQAERQNKKGRKSINEILFRGPTQIDSRAKDVTLTHLAEPSTQYLLIIVRLDGGPKWSNNFHKS